VCYTPFPEFGPVTPFIPLTCGAAAGNSHLLPDDVRCLLPNIPGIRRGFLNMRRLGANPNTALPYDHDLGDTQTPANAPVARGHNAANEQAANGNITPGTMFPPLWDPRTASNFQRFPTRIHVPDLPNHGVDWNGFLGFTDGIDWFGGILDVMQSYTKYWTGSTSLASMSAVNGSAPLTVVTLTDVYNDRNAHRAVNALRVPTTGEASMSFTSEDDLSPKLGMLTQINSILPPNYGPNDNIGAINTTRHGPWWNVAPIRSVSASYNPSILVGSVLSNHMALERPSSDPIV